MTKRAEYIERQSRDSATFDGTFQTLGSALSDPACLIKVVNNSTVDIDISVDGTTNHDFVPAGSFFLYDLRANHGRENDFVFIKGTQVYVKGAAGTGSVYLTVIRERP